MGTTDDDIEQKLDEKRAELSKLLNEIAKLHSLEREEDDEPFVVAWALAYEFTSVKLELESKAGRRVFVADNQMISTSLGLGHYLRKAFT